MGLTKKNEKQHIYPTSLHKCTGVCFKMLWFVMEYTVVLGKRKAHFEALTASFVQRSKILVQGLTAQQEVMSVYSEVTKALARQSRSFTDADKSTDGITAAMKPVLLLC